MKRKECGDDLVVSDKHGFQPKSRLLCMSKDSLALVLSFSTIAWTFHTGEVLCKRIRHILATCPQAYSDVLSMSGPDQSCSIEGGLKTSNFMAVAQRLLDRRVCVRLLHIWDTRPCVGSDMLDAVRCLAPKNIHLQHNDFTSNQVKMIMSDPCFFGEQLEEVIWEIPRDTSVWRHVLQTHPRIHSITTTLGKARGTRKTNLEAILAHVPNLTDLDVSEDDIDFLNAEEIRMLGEAPCASKLKTFAGPLGESAFERQSLCALSNLTALETLDLDIDWKQMDENQDVSLCLYLPNLVSVHLTTWVYGNCRPLAFIGDKLKTLWLESAQGLRTSALRDLLLRSPHLEELTLQGFSHLSRFTFEGFEAKHLWKLEIDFNNELLADYNEPCDPDKFLAACSKWPKLTVLKLDLPEKTLLTDLSQLNPNVQTLHLNPVEMGDETWGESNLHELHDLKSLHLTRSPCEQAHIDSLYTSCRIVRDSAFVLSDAVVTQKLRFLTKLEDVTLGSATLSANVLYAFADMPRLKGLHLTASPAINKTTVFQATGFWDKIRARGQQGTITVYPCKHVAFCSE